MTKEFVCNFEGRLVGEHDDAQPFVMVASLFRAYLFSRLLLSGDHVLDLFQLLGHMNTDIFLVGLHFS